jgi:hypothetical protein
MVVFSDAVLNEFDSHSAAVRQRARDRQEAVRLRATVDDTSASAVVDIRDTLGVRLPQDKFEGCTNLRTLRTLLSIVDDRGFERSTLTPSPYASLLIMCALTDPARCLRTRSPSNGLPQLF